MGWLSTSRSAIESRGVGPGNTSSAGHQEEKTDTLCLCNHSEVCITIWVTSSSFSGWATCAICLSGLVSMLVSMSLAVKVNHISACVPSSAAAAQQRRSWLKFAMFQLRRSKIRTELFQFSKLDWPYHCTREVPVHRPSRHHLVRVPHLFMGPQI